MKKKIIFGFQEKRFCCSGTSKKNEEDLKTAKRLKTGPAAHRNVEVKVGPYLHNKYIIKKGGNGNYVSPDMIYFRPHQRRTAFNVCPRIGLSFLLKMFAAGCAGSFVFSVSVFQSAIPAISPGLSDGEMSGGQVGQA